MTVNTVALRKRASGLKKYFLRKGFKGRTVKLFHDFPDEIREIMTREASLQGDDLPVVASFLGETQWAIITTTRLFVKFHDQLDVIVLDKITRISLKCVDEPNFKPNDKLTERLLKIETQCGFKCYVELEPNAPLAAFWAILQTAVSLEKDAGTANLFRGMPG